MNQSIREDSGPRLTNGMSSVADTIGGVGAVLIMMAMYAPQRCARWFILALAIGSSTYGFLSGAWPYGAIEFVWSGIALRRYRSIVTL